METHVLYHGNVILNFDPEKHLYTVDREKIDGVTSVLGIIAKPQLIGWAANMAADYVAQNIRPGLALDELQIKSLTDEARAAHRKRKEKAGDIGTAIHAWIEKYIGGDVNQALPVHREICNGVVSFLGWIKDNRVEFERSECKIFSREHRYSGTCDFVARVNGKRMVGDFKTGSGIYDEAFLQTAAYQSALVEEGYGEFDGNIVVNIRKDGTLETKESADYAEHKEGFLAALALYRWQQKQKMKLKQ